MFICCRVRLHYARGWFTPDCIALIPMLFDLVLARLLSDCSDNCLGYRTIRILRLFRVGKLMKFEGTHYTVSAAVMSDSRRVDFVNRAHNYLLLKNLLQRNDIVVFIDCLTY